MKLRMEPTPELTQKSTYRFGNPLHLDIHGLDSVLDCFSPNPQGNWAHNPKPTAPLSHYRAAREAMELIAPLGYGSVGEYLLSRVDNHNLRSILEKILEESK